MKKIFTAFIMVASVTFAIDLQAQWQLNGNHAYNTNSGNVGVGTSNPAAKLHVAGGNILLDNDWYLSALRSNGSSQQIFGIDPNNDMVLNRGSIVSGFTSAVVIGYKGRNFDIREGTNTVFRINANGNVGIGSDDPSANLHIQETLTGSTNPHTAQKINLAIASSTVQSGDLTGLDIQLTTETAGIFSSGTATGLRVDVSDVVASATGNATGNAATFTGGNVGIGTTTPSHALDIQGDLRVGQSGTPIMRVVAGRVFDGGTKQLGEGFTSTRTSTGKYLLTFETPFSNDPVIVGNVAHASDNLLSFTVLTDSTVEVTCRDASSNTLENHPFSFIVLGVSTSNTKNTLKAGIIGENATASPTVTNNRGERAPAAHIARLEQNHPNPFDQHTTIRYTLPEKTGEASLMVYNMNGEQLMRFDNLEHGENSIEIEGSKLGAGMYFYSLVADGKEVDTKRMILMK